MSSISSMGKSLMKSFIQQRADQWAMDNRTLKGRPYRFDGTLPVQKRAFLRQPLADESRQKTYQKSRQCGLSETCVSEVLFLCHKHRYRKFMYVFPTYGQMKDFVQTRVNPTILDSPKIAQSLTKKGFNNTRLKHIADCDLFFRGGQKAGTGEGVDLDGIFLDERDRMWSSILDAYKEGLTASDLGLIRDISTPSLPNMGVNISFELSDKKHWFVKCTKCGTSQTLEYPVSIVRVKALVVPGVDDGYRFRCKKCKSWDCLDRSQGEWVAQRNETVKEWSGYQISQLDCFWISANEIMRKSKKYLPQFFFNYVLGRPYIGSNLLILQSHINKCLAKGLIRVTRIGQVLMGVDWGDVSWVVIGMVTQDKLTILHYEKIIFTDPAEHVKRVKCLIDDWNIDITVCDSGYGKDRNAALLKILPLGKIRYCQYAGDREGKKCTIVENIWGVHRMSVRVNRTITLRVMASAWKNETIILPDSLVYSNPVTEEFFQHLKSLAVVLEEVAED